MSKEALIREIFNAQEWENPYGFQFYFKTHCKFAPGGELSCILRTQDAADIENFDTEYLTRVKNELEALHKLALPLAQDTAWEYGAKAVFGCLVLGRDEIYLNYDVCETEAGFLVVGVRFDADLIMDPKAVYEIC